VELTAPFQPRSQPKGNIRRISEEINRRNRGSASGQGRPIFSNHSGTEGGEDGKTLRKRKREPEMDNLSRSLSGAIGPDHGWPERRSSSPEQNCLTWFTDSNSGTGREIPKVSPTKPEKVRNCRRTPLSSPRESTATSTRRGGVVAMAIVNTA